MAMAILTAMLPAVTGTQVALWVLNGFLTMVLAVILFGIAAIFRTVILKWLGGENLLSSAISTLAGLAIGAAFCVLLIFVGDATVPSLRKTVVGWSAEKIEKATGIENPIKPTNIKL